MNTIKRKYFRKIVFSHTYNDFQIYIYFRIRANPVTNPPAFVLEAQMPR